MIAASSLRLLLSSLVCVAAIASAAFSATAAPVQTEGGLVEGVSEDGVVVFKGIPFAAPPVGVLRWRAPQSAAPWAGVKIADRFAPICMQRGSYPEDAPAEPMSEDCLYLNVWVPAGAAAGANLPVMVWIYGGGLENGTASTPLYAGDALAGRGVIVVTANYRLGALGFLAHPALSRESPNKVSGNYGLFDQLAALQWVKRNIAAFGGDPGNVTVFGQSSGAISISVLSASPLAQGLFRRAIGQSGGLFEPLELAPDFALAGAEQDGIAFAVRLGAASINALRERPAADIVAARYSPHAVIDGYLLHEPPFDALAGGRGNEVDILIGSNAEEGLAFLGGRTVTAANLSALLTHDFPPFIVSLIGPGTPTDDAAAKAAFVAFESDMRFGWDMLAWARLHAAAGRGKTFLYRFAHAPPGTAGASHGAEMAYVFGHPATAWTEGDHRLAETMGAYWTNFAKTGDPNAPGLPAWPAFAPAREEAQLIGREITAGALPNADDLAAIDRLYATVRFVANNLYLVGGVALVLVIALLVFLWRAVRRLLRRGTSP
jgi:para-nitrobenzyl esterase